MPDGCEIAVLCREILRFVAVVRNCSVSARLLQPTDDGVEWAVEGMAGRVAPIVKMGAPIMAAANFRARETGWGFGVSTPNSVAWPIIGLSSGQTHLLAINRFLTLIACEIGQSSYVLVASSGLGCVDDTLRAVARENLRLHSERVDLLTDRTTFETCAALGSGDWHAEVPSCQMEGA